MNWEEYEKYCMKKWINKHPTYKGEITKKNKYGADGGVDIIFTTERGTKVYAQCKNYKKSYKGENKVERIPVKEIRALKGCMARDGIKYGIFFSPAEFSKQDKDEAKKDKIAIRRTRI